MIITSFSDFNKPLNEAPKNLKGKKLHNWLIKQLKHRDRVCVWEIDYNMKVCRALMFLVKIGKLRFDKSTTDYPYTKIVVVR